MHRWNCRQTRFRLAALSLSPRLTTMLDGGFAFSGRETRPRHPPARRRAALARGQEPGAARDRRSQRSHRRGQPRPRTDTPEPSRGPHSQGGSASVNAWWFAAARGRRVFRLVAVTPTRELSPGSPTRARRSTPRPSGSPTACASTRPGNARWGRQPPPVPRHDYVVAKMWAERRPRGAGWRPSPLPARLL